MILISWHEPIANEQEYITLLFSMGLPIFQLRKPNMNINQMRLYLNAIPAEYHPRIMLHSHYELMNEYHLKGISFTHSTKKRHGEYKKTTGVKTWAAHTVEELYTIPNDIQKVFLSPVFPSISKQGYTRTWTTEELTRFLRSCANKPFELVALGGITPSNVKEALEIGFNDYAVLGFIWSNAKKGTSAVVNAFHQFQTI